LVILTKVVSAVCGGRSGVGLWFCFVGIGLRVLQQNLSPALRAYQTAIVFPF